jgi:hypothetical protein
LIGRGRGFYRLGCGHPDRNATVPAGYLQIASH